VPDIQALTGRDLLAPYASGIMVGVGSLARCMWIFNDQPDESVLVEVTPPEAYDDTRSMIEHEGGVRRETDGWSWYLDWNGYGATVLAATDTATVQVGVDLVTPMPEQMAIAIATAVMTALGESVPPSPAPSDRPDGSAAPTMAPG
jgi:hypothetical protein